MRPFIFTSLLCLTFLNILPFSIADTIVFNDGRKLETKNVWEEGNEIKCYIDGMVFGFPKNKVQKIEKAALKKKEMPAPQKETDTLYFLWKVFLAYPFYKPLG